eukprot:Lankesteria_metandrocarpae@DN2415_c0_g1_i3.p1
MRGLGPISKLPPADSQLRRRRRPTHHKHRVTRKVVTRTDTGTSHSAEDNSNTVVRQQIEEEITVPSSDEYPMLNSLNAALQSQLLSTLRGGSTFFTSVQHHAHHGWVQAGSAYTALRFRIIPGVTRWIFAKLLPACCYFSITFIVALTVAPVIYKVLEWYLIPPRVHSFPVSFNYHPQSHPRSGPQPLDEEDRRFTLNSRNMELQLPDVATAHVSFTSFTWELMLADELKRDSRFAYRFKKNSFAFGWEYDVSIVFRLMGSAYVSNTTPGPFHHSCRGGWCTDGESNQRRLHGDRCGGCANPQPLPQEPVMFTAELHTTDELSFAHSQRAFFPSGNELQSWYAVLQSDLPWIVRLAWKFSVLCYTSILEFISIVLPWIRADPFEYRVMLFERLPHSKRLPLAGAVIQMRPLLPVMTPAFLVFETRLSGLPGVMRDHAWLCHIVFINFFVFWSMITAVGLFVRNTSNFWLDQ